MTQPLRRKTDTERLSVCEVEISHMKEDVTAILKEIKGVIRNQWITAGALAALVMLMDHPQLVNVIKPAEARVEMKR